MSSTTDDAVACRLDATDLAARRESLAELCRDAQEVRELPDGYALRFAGDAAHARALLEAILEQRAGCPFLAFDLGLEPHGGPIWLRVRGPDGTRGFLHSLFATALPG